MRIKVDVTPGWWTIEAKNPETFALWCVKAVRSILTTWPDAEVRLSREMIVVVVTVHPETRVGDFTASKLALRSELAAVVLDNGIRDHRFNAELVDIFGRDRHSGAL